MAYFVISETKREQKRYSLQNKSVSNKIFWKFRMFHKQEYNEIRIFFVHLKFSLHIKNLIFLNLNLDFKVGEQNKPSICVNRIKTYDYFHHNKI